MPDFYVYAYLREDRTPFYIGKGQKNRINRKRKFDLPREDLRVKLFENLTEEDALDLEMEVIKYYGKENLINKTTGGQGVSGLRFKMPPDSVEVRRTKLKELYADPEFYADFCAKMKGNNKGAHRSEEQREKTRKTLTKGQVWKFKNPQGELVIIEGSLNKWCQDNELNTGAMCQVHKGNPKFLSHKGWIKY